MCQWAEWCKREFGLSSVEPAQFQGTSGHALSAFDLRQFQELTFVKEHGTSLFQFLERIKSLASSPTTNSTWKGEGEGGGRGREGESTSQ